MKFWKKDKPKSTNPFENDSDTSSQYSNTESTIKPSASTIESSRYNSLSPEPTLRYQTPSPDSSTKKPSRYSTPPPEPRKSTRYGSPPDPNYSQNRRHLFDGYSEPNYEQEDDNEEDQQVLQTKNQIRNIKQESLASTRNALQKINEAEDAASNTMNMLGTQSTQIANVDRNLDLSKAYSDKASNQAGELKQLNRSIFIPVIKNPFNKSSRERKKLDKINQEHEQHIKERDDIRKFEYDSNARYEATQRKLNHTQSHSGRTESDRRRYQFEPDQEDEDIEDEIDSNLNQLGDVTNRLRTMAISMNDELDSQNKQLNKINKKVDPISSKLMATTHTLDSTK